MKYTTDDVVKFAEDAMEEKERANFEQVLALDPTLRQQVQEYYQLRRTLHMGMENDLGKEALKDTLAKLNHQYFGQNAKGVSFGKTQKKAILAVAAVLLVLFIWSPWKTNPYGQFSEIGMPRMTESGTRADSLKILGEEAFNKKDFKAAVQHLSLVYNEDKENVLISFYYGVALMQTDSLIKSRKIFENIYSGESAYKYKAAFFSALSYLRGKDKKTAAEWLEKIPADADNYDKAIELLKKIK